MNIDPQIAEEILDKVQQSQNILIISHRNPDPDCLGSNLALRQIFITMGKNVDSACVDEIPDIYNFFSELKDFKQDVKPKKYDLFFTLDCGSVDQAGLPVRYPQIASLEKPLINIDHHPSNSYYGSINLINDHAASTTMILYYLLLNWKVKISPYLATCLLFGLYYDTGSFMHSSVDDDVLKVASELLEKGARQSLIVKKLFKNHTVEQLRVWGKALSNVRVTENNVIVTGIMEKDFNECRANASDLSGLIDYLSSVNGTKFATILSHDAQGNVRGSLRTRREDVNVSEIAKNFGGGGHKKASGFSIKGKLNKKTYWSITSD